jgi:SAM-dependent methyltransferase
MFVPVDKDPRLKAGFRIALARFLYRVATQCLDFASTAKAETAMAQRITAPAPTRSSIAISPCSRPRSSSGKRLNPINETRVAYRTGAKIDARAWVGRYVMLLISPTSRVLEIGCRSGILVAELARSHVGARVTGIDSSEIQIGLAKKRCAALPNASVQLGCATALGFADSSFDLVYSRFLIDSVPDKARSVAEIVRVCRPGGKVLLQDLVTLPVGHKPNVARQTGLLDRADDAQAETERIPFPAANVCSLLHCFGMQKIHVCIERYDNCKDSALFTATGTKP